MSKFPCVLTPDQAKTALDYKKYIALDTESTGFQPNDNFSVLLEIGAVKVINDVIVDRFDELINPGVSIPKKIQELTGITNEMVANKPPYNEVLVRFREWCNTDDFIFIMHNAPHDLTWLNYFGKKCGVSFEDPTIDTQPFAKEVLKGNYWKTISKGIKENYKLSSLATLFEIKDKNHHRADNDAEVTYEVFSNLRKVAFKRQSDLFCFQCYKYPVKETKKEEKTRVKIVSICPWDKMARIYIQLKKEEDNEEKFATIFYDFKYKNWRIKEAGFPISSFETIEKKIKNLYRTDEMEYKNFPSKKYPACVVKLD